MEGCPKFVEYPPKWYVPVHYIIGIITIPLAIYTYIIINKVHITHMDKQYIKYMHLFHLWVSAASLHNNFCMIINYMPAMLSFALGFLSINPIVDFLIGCLLKNYIITFGSVLALHRLFLCMYGQNIPKYSQIIVICYVILGATVYPAFLIRISLYYNQNMANTKLLKLCPQFFPIASQYPVMFSISPELSTAPVALGVVCIVMGVGSTAFLYFSHSYLKKNSMNLSEKAKKIHLKLLFILMIQIAVPTVLHIVPGIIVGYIYNYRITLPLVFPLCVWSFGSFDAIINGFILLYYNPPYKARVKYELSSLLCNVKRTSSIVSTISRSGVSMI